MNEFEIMFRDLTEDAQLRLLSAMNISTPEEMNWDVFGIASVPLPEE